MLRNYFITALRNILRNRIQALIQVASLAIGITSAIVIGLYVQHEFSYDRFNEKLDRIYRVEFGNHVALWSAIGHQIKQEIPEVENVVRLMNWCGKDCPFFINYIPSGDSSNIRQVEVTAMYYCDSSFLDVFTVSFIQGNPATALRDPQSCVISESTARRIFGERDPVGESLRLEHVNLAITGVFEEVKNSHIDLNMLVSMTTIDSMYGFPRGHPEYMNYYQSQHWMTYVLLPEDADPLHIENRIDDFFREKWKTDFAYEAENSFHLRPLRDIYFSSNLERELNTFNHGNLKQLRVLTAVALFILALGIINYINLTTARASLRAREVGIRKVVGATKSRLIAQFLAEAVLVTLISFLVGLTMVQLLLPGFSRLASTDLQLQFLEMPGTWIIIPVAAILLGMVSGIYPSLYMTRFQPITSLAGGHFKGNGSLILRRTLLTFQFSVSIILVIGMLLIFRQLNYMKTTDPGFNQELVVNFGSGGDYLWQFDPLRRQLIRERLLQYPSVRLVTFSSGMAGGEQIMMPEPIELNGTKKSIAWLSIDPYFTDLMGIEMKYGRNFLWDRQGDYTPRAGGDWIRKMIVNETFVREFELESPVGELITWPSEFQNEIIGVIRDFHYTSLHEKIQPTVIFWGPFLPVLTVKISPRDIQSTLEHIQSELSSLFPEFIESWKYSFLDETYASQYIRDEKTAGIIINFAIVAILISCLGLFGLSNFMAARRIKEIGVRKAFGASERSVFLLLSQEFVRWIVVSAVIACPLAWIILHRWLQSFAYRTTITWWVFVLAILIVFAIAFVTATWQSLKTARTNTVDSLRNE